MKRYIKADIIDISEDDRNSKLTIASDPNTRPATLDRLALEHTRNPSEVLKAVAANPSTPPKTLQRIAEQFSGSGIVGTALENPNMSEEVLRRFAENTNYFNRISVARNPNTPKDILSKLAHDDIKFVRRNVANNPNTPADVLAQLVVDDWKFVRWDALSNPNIDPAVREEFYEEPDIYTIISFDFKYGECTFNDIDSAVQEITETYGYIYLGADVGRVDYSDYGEEDVYQFNGTCEYNKMATKDAVDSLEDAIERKLVQMGCQVLGFEWRTCDK